MATEASPLGSTALHPDWPQARFNVSGMFTHHPLIIQLIQVVEAGFNCRLPIEAVHGAPAIPWNGGRWSRITFDPAEFTKTLSFLYSRNIGYYPTFTNHLITNDELSNPLGNQILAMISQRPDLNGVILTSEMLSRYIADKYPTLKQIASITKVELEGGAGRVEYYRELGKRFHRYVVHPDDCCNLELLRQLEPAKAEIIVNENCARNCPQRSAHFNAYARVQRATTQAEQQSALNDVNAIVDNCPSPMHLNRISDHTLSCNLSREEMKAAYDLGFRHFKFQGRADDPRSFVYDLARFMLEPRVASPLALKAMMRWLEHVLVRVRG